MTLPASRESEPPLGIEDLIAELRDAAKPPAQWRVGLEHEKLAVRADGRPVPYAGPLGMLELLEALTGAGFTPVCEGSHLIGAVGPRRVGGGGQDKVSLEPGAQLEQAGVPARSVAAAAVDLREHVALVESLGAPLGIRFIHGGFRPWGALDDVDWLPKARYRVMREYLPTRGRLAAEMMKRTATLQVNFDFGGDADVTTRFRTAMAVSPIVTALAAASPITDGRPSGFKSYRAQVWNETDEARCGQPAFAFTSTDVLPDYVQWALDVPMFFIARGGQLLPARGVTFRRFMREGLDGHTATRADWQVHLSTLFPDVRLKHTLEVRGADAAPLPVALGVAALCRGLQDDPGARQAAWELLAAPTFVERQALHAALPRAGLAAELGGRVLAELAVELVEIARRGLRALPHGEEDVPLLEPVAELAAAGRCPADQMLEQWRAEGGQPARLVELWSLRAQ